MTDLDIYLDPLNSPGVMSAKMWIREGSRADPKDQKGLHQLLGSVLSRGCGPYSNIALSDLVEGAGAGLHCETYEDGYLISLKCNGSDAYKLLPIIGWMIKEPHLKNNQINLEKELSIRSIKRQKENPISLAFDTWRYLAYGNGPYGHDPLGTIEDLQRIDKEDLSILSKKLLRRKKFLVIAGTMPKSLKKEITTMEPFNTLQDTSSIIQPGTILSKDSKPYRSKQSCTYILRTLETSQVIIMLGSPTIAYANKDNLLLELLTCHLGSGMSSKLFIDLREKHGVAYDVGAHHLKKEHSSPFILHASTTEDKSLHTLKLLKKCWMEIQETQISEGELNLVRAKYRSQLAHTSQTVAQHAERKAHLLGLNLPADYDQRNLKRIESITSKDLMEAAARYLKKPLLCLCGPEKSIRKLAETWQS